MGGGGSSIKVPADCLPECVPSKSTLPNYYPHPSPALPPSRYPRGHLHWPVLGNSHSLCLEPCPDPTSQSPAPPGLQGHGLGSRLDMWPPAFASAVPSACSFVSLLVLLSCRVSPPPIGPALRGLGSLPQAALSPHCLTVAFSQLSALPDVDLAAHPPGAQGLTRGFHCAVPGLSSAWHVPGADSCYHQNKSHPLAHPKRGPGA